MNKSSVPPSERTAKEIQALLDGERKEGESLLTGLFRASIQRIVHEALEQEVSAFLGRGWYERGSDDSGDAAERRPWRNGYKERNLRTAEGLIPIQVPQVRNTQEPYRSELWPHLKGNSDELNRVVTELYARGLSTRDIEEVFKDPQTGRRLLSKSQVSEITDSLNEEYVAFTKRSLGGFDVVYLFLDAVYEPLRRAGRSREAILCCWGILSDGSKILLHLDLAGTESYAAWKGFLTDMVRRGLPAPLTVTTDGSPGAIRAVEEVWSDAIRIRCWVHKMQNVLDKVPQEAHGDVKAFLTSIRDAPNWATGRQLADQFIETYRREYGRAVAAFEDDLEASLTHLQLPAIHRRSVRTTNLMERSFVEERRRTKVIPRFMNEESGLKLIFATLWRVSERWRGVRFSEHEQRQIAKLRARMRSTEESDTQPHTGNDDLRITA